MINPIGWSVTGEALCWFCVLPFRAFHLFFCVVAIVYGNTHDKWPGRLKELTRSVLVVSAVGLENTPRRLAC